MNDTETTERAGPTSPPSTALAKCAVVRTIVVNGRSHLFAGDEIGTKELAQLAFPEQDGRAYAALTVAYERGPLVAESGLMTGRTTTPVAEGQSFSVSLTDKS